MRYICIFICLFYTSLSALSIHDWENIRFSDTSAENKLYLRTERGAGSYNLNNVVYSTSGGTMETPLGLIDAATHTYQAYLPAASGTNYYGMRSQAGNGPLQIIPTCDGGTGLPTPSHLTKLSDDPANDNATQHYDIVADYVALTDTKLIVGLKNRGGGFPTSGGFLVYNSYMCAVGDPSLEDPNDPDAVVWALHYVNAAGLMTPGLYKVTGTTINDVTRIAGIDYQINASSNTLVMSCDLSVLMADPDFMAWFNPAQPRFGLISVTARITLSGVTQQDNSMGGVIHPRPVAVVVGEDHFGEVSDPALVIGEDEVFFEANYNKPEDRFNWGMNFAADGEEMYPMTTLDPETASQRYYRTANLISVLPEVDNGLGTPYMEVLAGEQIAGGAYSYSFVRDVRSPENVAVQLISEDNLQISWSSVAQTTLGTAISVDNYRLEYSIDISGPFQFLLNTQSTSVIVPRASVGDKAFFRVIAQKDIP